MAPFIILGAAFVLRSYATTTYPDANNTGIQGCPSLTTYNGSITTNSDGQIIQNMTINGDIVVNNNNVTIRCVKLNMQPNTIYSINASNGSNTLISHVEVNGNDVYGPNTAIQGSDYTSEYVDMHNTEDGWHAGWNTVIRDSYCHDMLYADGAYGPTHSDCIQVTGYGGASFEPPVNNITISHNTLRPWDGHTGAQHANSAVFLKTDFGEIDNVLVDNNLMDNGTYTIYSRIGNCSGCGAPTNVKITNNRFGQGYEYGLSSIDGSVTWLNNVWNSTGTMIGEDGSAAGGTGNKIGDFNTDGVVNIYDLGIFLAKWQTNSAAQDLNTDGTVNIYDLGIFLSHYGT